MAIIPAAPDNLRECRLYEVLLKKNSPETGAAERVESFVSAANPVSQLHPVEGVC